MDSIKRSCENCRHWRRDSARPMMEGCARHPPIPVINPQYGEIHFVLPKPQHPASFECAEWLPDADLSGRLWTGKPEPLTIKDEEPGEVIDDEYIVADKEVQPDDVIIPAPGNPRTDLDDAMAAKICECELPAPSKDIDADFNCPRCQLCGKLLPPGTDKDE